MTKCLRCKYTRDFSSSSYGLTDMQVRSGCWGGTSLKLQREGFRLSSGLPRRPEDYQNSESRICLDPREPLSRWSRPVHCQSYVFPQDVPVKPTKNLEKRVFLNEKDLQNLIGS
ncbi:hypothetical protein AVEN_89550-1 [Araneus ventricosus]|uniref:Uncharacterized protein n=1 Tax=Araneus ventricosus TaxID=182803 RepID=A0A4Y2AVZ8_ARAVE|nr:hypothetical protein AVEN_89550-1 [Araneus ventricosus]